MARGESPSFGEQLTKFLNHLLQLDPRAVDALFSFRVTCGRKLAGHPTVQVLKMSEDFYQLGALGILNGITGPKERIEAIYRDDGSISHFRLGESPKSLPERGMPQ